MSLPRDEVQVPATHPRGVQRQLQAAFGPVSFFDFLGQPQIGGMQFVAATMGCRQITHDAADDRLRKVIECHFRE